LSKLLINGGRPLHGEVYISGCKNSAVALIPAALLVDGSCTIENIPNISDVIILLDIIKCMGGSFTYIDKNTVTIDTTNISDHRAIFNCMKKLRASYYMLGALLGRFGKAEIDFPGGCDFGFRPMDQHIKGFEAMGAKIDVEHGIINATSEGLTGAHIYLDVVSVGATINLMLAAVKAEGITTIENAAKEPHIVDVANFLNAMGANIRGAGTDIIKIKGVEKLIGGNVHCIIPDQIETGTFMIATAATKGDVTIGNIIPKHVESLTAKLLEMNVGVEQGEDSIRVYNKGPINKANIKTLPYPGFPTDLHPQMAVLLCMAEGVSTITEGVWDLRFQYVDELKRMGANIKVEGRIAVIEGGKKITGAKIRAMDLRAGAALVIAALAAEGQSEISGVNYINRGYENLDKKFASLGADIVTVNDNE